MYMLQSISSLLSCTYNTSVTVLIGPENLVIRCFGLCHLSSKNHDIYTSFSNLNSCNSYCKYDVSFVKGTGSIKNSGATSILDKHPIVDVNGNSWEEWAPVQIFSSDKLISLDISHGVGGWGSNLA
ncbi:hypothetical protein VNO77_19730 [Canavalia gladiata]|uniref:Uncharacterized protein n=1 Tax=Canavalia gladiata TaxID=3824 RepID=A0AAN9LN57_CANGL